MIELIFSIIFVISLVGLLIILALKIPALVTMPQNGKTGIKKHKIVLDIESKVKEIFISFEKQILLHKLLSKVKCWILRLETMVDQGLHNIRKKNKK